MVITFAEFLNTAAIYVSMYQAGAVLGIILIGYLSDSLIKNVHQLCHYIVQ